MIRNELILAGTWSCQSCGTPSQMLPRAAVKPHRRCGARAGAGGDRGGPTAPPPVTMLTSSGHVGRGDIFITPTGDTGTYANGPEILDPTATSSGSTPIPPGQTAADFARRRYDGQPVLTWWQGTGLGGLSSGTDYIYNNHYQQIATVNAGNGLSADGHEFLITPWNTALILAYTTATADLTSIGGPADQTVIDGVVQEIDIRTGKVLFQWNSADHVPYGAERAAAARVGRAPRGTGSTSTPCTSTATATC